MIEEFALNFNDGKVIADQKKTVGALYSFTFDTREEVDEFCAKAKANGGRFYTNKFNQEQAADFMHIFEVEDPDGYILEPLCMDISKFPGA